jgi:CheY-like chemotaxis protein
VPPVLGSRPDLRNALANVVFNAVDALPLGGTITFRSRVEGDHVLLQVSDSGTGMPEEVRRRCLEPFFTTKPEHGTGLGLAIVRDTVRQHHGLLDLWSVAGEGTTVSIRLPAAPRAAEPAHEPVVAIGAIPPLRILVVDDEPLVRRLLADYLAIDGHAVETATNGRHALDRFRAGRYDLVVTDRAMPEMGGDELAAAIRRLSFDEPVIMLTGFGDLMLAADERPLGVDLVLSKPVTPAALRQAVARVAPAALREAEKPAWQRGPSSYVMVVDDDPWICDVLKTALEAAGYEVAVAVDGLQALEMVEERLPAVIVLDMMMPNMDGGTFADELRRRGLRERVPLIVVTAASQVRRRVEHIGAEVYLSKPFALPTLLDAVARLAGSDEPVASGAARR